MNAESAFFTCPTFIRRGDNRTIASAAMEDEFRMVMIERRFPMAVIENFLLNQRGLKMSRTFVAASRT
jgi:hypothetical protein